MRAAQPVHAAARVGVGRVAGSAGAVARPSPEPPTLTTDSALAALDAHARHARRSGLFAADVLEQLNTTCGAAPVELGPTARRAEFSSTLLVRDGPGVAAVEQGLQVGRAGLRGVVCTWARAASS